MLKLYKYNKHIAALFLVTLSASFMLEQKVMALTSGPDQPEMKGFQPAGMNDLVDLFTGDFKYNIPLLDVGGYPLNLSYASGQSMDDEASWVGFGWSLTPPAVNRQLRGVPDDFDGSQSTNADVVEKQLAMKPSITRGIGADIMLKVKGKRIKGLDGVKVGLSFSNLTGINAEIGFNSTVSLNKEGSTTQALNLGVTSNNQDGGSLNGAVNFSLVAHDKQNSEYKVGKSLGFGYNATRGLEGMTLSSSFSIRKMRMDAYAPNISASNTDYISFAGDSYISGIETPLKSKNTSFTLRGGTYAIIPSWAQGITGFYSKQEVDPAAWRRDYPAFGIMNAYKGRNVKSAIMDYNKENDRPYMRATPYLPIPVINQDLFNVSNQTGGGQYKISSLSSGIMFSSAMRSKDKRLGLGLEVDGGAVVEAAIDFNYSNTTSSSEKWTDKNDFKTIGDYVVTSPSLSYKPETYFKKVGNMNVSDPGFSGSILDKEPVSVSLDNSFVSNTIGNGKALSRLTDKQGKTASSQIIKASRETRPELFSYLTASEAAKYGLDKTIKSYPLGTVVVNGCNDNLVTGLTRISNELGKKNHHISEITILDEAGTRNIYGVPVYNLRQDEVSFSVAANEDARKKGLIQFHSTEDSVPTSSSDSRFGSKDYRFSFNKQRLRGYASSFLLTGILSADYVDVTGNGISDDDRGNAVKFNYTKIGDFKWRTPFINDGINVPRMANYNEGFLSDKKDDKASYVYGEKEQWYLHSVESKTMLAIFILEDREDGLGVSSTDGDLNTGFRLKRLKEIRLYSKAELNKNISNLSAAVPIKTVHFEYAYELFDGIPNSLNHSKLTLKKVYFTFGNNNQGQLQPYLFEYNIPDYQLYSTRQYDRWGAYKPADSCNRSGLNNSEFPYSTQDADKANRWAGYWQLRSIQLPSGGTINVNYESDDYAYVQNKRSQSMCFIKGIGGETDSINIIKANTVFIDLPYPVSNPQELKERYFGDMSYLYFKAYVDLNNKGANFEYIPGYAKIEKIELHNSTTAKVTISKQDDYNPVSKAAWSIMRTSLPRLAYPEYDNLDSDDADVIKAIKSLIGAIDRIADILRSFDKRAENKKFASKFFPSRSWVRLANPGFKKYGGGSRVKSILMSDKWSEMTGDATVKTAIYGQKYEYTTEHVLVNGNKIPISSGVASYEPLVGNDENPFKTPVLFTQKKILGLDEYYSIEMPLCESYYPGPGIGYSRVKVSNIGADNSEGATGSTTSEFYTAKDFPTIVRATSLQRKQPVVSKLLKFFSIKLTDHATVSQGYAVENANMHGKEKSTLILDKTGQEISSLSYEYKISNKFSPNKQLKNVVPTVSRAGVITHAEIGVDYDFYTEMNQHRTESIGVRGEPVVGFYYLGFPRPWFNVGAILPNYDKKLFRSAVAIKTINYFPILEKVIKREKGSRIETENLLWDEVTGDVLLTKSQNEFDDPVYSFTYPAHWAYSGMGLASGFQGTYISSFSTTNTGLLGTLGNNLLLFPGDELIDILSSTPKRYWIIKGTDGQLRTVDEHGGIAVISNTTVKVLRAGKRNLASAGIGTLISLNSPLREGQLNLAAMNKVLDARAVEYKEEWDMPVKLRCGDCVGGSRYTDGPYTFCYSLSQPGGGCINYCMGRRGHHTFSPDGTHIYNDGYSTDGSGTYSVISLSNPYWHNINDNSTGGPLNRCGVWLSGNGGYPTSIWIGRSFIFDVPETKKYYIGLGGDDYLNSLLDGNTLVLLGNPAPNNRPTSDNWRVWHVYPVELTAGTHILEVSGLNAQGDVSFGFELYDNTKAQLEASTIANPPNIILSSASITSSNTFDQYTGGCKTCPYGYAYNPLNNTCYKMIKNVGYPNTFNPYLTGQLGNWHASKESVFDVSRVNLKSNPSLAGSTDIRNSGYYRQFAPFWNYYAGNWISNTANPSFQQWRWRNQIMQFNIKGMEVENKDALGRYSAVQMGYLESLPVAVADNAPLRNMAYDGFEDYSFDLQCGTDICNPFPSHFNVKSLINGSSIKIDATEAHTGKSSLKLSTSLTISRPVYDGTSSLYTRDELHQFRLNNNYPLLGFNPAGPGKYILSMWVKDNNPSSVAPNMSLSINGMPFNLSALKLPVIEGWKRLEIEFTQSSGLPFSLSIAPEGGTLYVDDLRIHPYSAQMKSFAYDPVSLRLMGELDENNFATFYEYDDEGVLVRVKKETEKGIMTIKESRTGIRKAL